MRFCSHQRGTQRGGTRLLAGSVCFRPLSGLAWPGLAQAPDCGQPHSGWASPTPPPTPHQYSHDHSGHTLPHSPPPGAAGGLPRGPQRKKPEAQPWSREGPGKGAEAGMQGGCGVASSLQGAEQTPTGHKQTKGQLTSVCFPHPSVHTQALATQQTAANVQTHRSHTHRHTLQQQHVQSPASQCHQLDRIQALHTSCSWVFLLHT